MPDSVLVVKKQTSREGKNLTDYQLT